MSPSRCMKEQNWKQSLNSLEVASALFRYTCKPHDIHTQTVAFLRFPNAPDYTPHCTRQILCSSEATVSELNLDFWA